jgi:hypothetical protein
MRGLEEWVGVRRERSEKVGDLGPVEGFHKLGKMDYVSALSFLHYTGNQRDGETWSRLQSTSLKPRLRATRYLA